MTFCVATLSTTHGFEIDSVEEALSLHFTYFFTSRKSQGKALGDTPSFYYLWSEHGSEPEVMVSRTKVSLHEYLKELFPVNEVEVGMEFLDGTKTVYNLSIAARVVEDNNAYDLAKVIEVTGEHYKVLDDARLNKGR